MLHVVPGVISLAAGIADAAVGVVTFIFGLRYATGDLVANPNEKGIIPPFGGSRTNLQNSGAFNFYVLPTEQGVAVGFAGTW